MKDRKEVLKRKIERYLKKEQIFKSDEHKRLEKPFLAKARKNNTRAGIDDNSNPPILPTVLVFILSKLIIILAPPSNKKKVI